MPIMEFFDLIFTKFLACGCDKTVGYAVAYFLGEKAKG